MKALDQPAALTRSTLLARLRASQNETPWDVIVVGGGATGLGTAVDAASRGYRTLLLEGSDFAKGTSSRATKLVHGGVRYLASGNIPLVREALIERGRLLSNAPHLVHSLGFIVPAYHLCDRPFYGAGLKLYDWLAGRQRFGSSRVLSRHDTLAASPNLLPDGMRGGILYYDGQFDDARLAVTLMRTVFDHGGLALNYLPVTGLERDRGRISGVLARDAESGETFSLPARCVINATGVWSNTVRRMDDEHVGSALSPSQGAHVVLGPEFLPGQHAVLIPKTDDGRVLFVVPWHGHTLVGTTDVPRQDTPLEPRPFTEEIDFILATAGRYLRRAPTRDDVLSCWAGLRPLVDTGASQATARLSREHAVDVSPGGLVSVTGGKWTTYRKMAEDVLDCAIEKGVLSASACRTSKLKLHGAPAEVADATSSVYGTDEALLAAQTGAQRQLSRTLGLSEAHVRFAARYELARTVEDVLARRNRAMFLNAMEAERLAPEVADLLADELGMGASWRENQLRQFAEVARGYRIDVSRPVAG